jgi:ATP-dependent phosphofructokinase / diphosphate-dependent phosphofructokinase
MAELVGNLLVAQSGGPTAVINASVAGVIREAGKHGLIEEIYGGLNGIYGILNEDLIDLNEEKNNAIEGLKYTPGAALGTCRYKIDFKKKPENAARDMDRLFEVFQAHNIRYFFYAGGNDSQDTSNQIHHEAVKRNYEIRVIGVPKTIDNDLPHTDHCPGFGSAAKFVATTVAEVAIDIGGMATDEGACCIIEIMGRTAGWLAASSVLAKNIGTGAPHVVLLPEVPFNEETFLAKVKEHVDSHNFCLVACGEGIRDASGELIGADKSRLDAFGHPVLSGAADRLAELVQGKLNTKTRTVKLGYTQRAAAHLASLRDIEEAVMCGEAAVRAAVEGRSGFMVKLVRSSENPYHCATDLQDLADIANAVHLVPRDWISEDGFLPNEKFVEYCRPLIEGEPKIAFENGLPKYTVLDRVPVDKVLAPRG